MTPAAPIGAFRLSAGVIQVWAARLDMSAGQAQLAACLTPDEREQAARYVFARDRHAYIAARGTLRHILAAYTGLAPESLVFEYNHQGKPSLAPACGGDWLRFNLSHSGSLALYALRPDGDVGVDIEQVRKLDDLHAVAASTFSAAEKAALRALPDDQQTEGFFTAWTRKEAFIKAVGTGLSYPLKDFDVTLSPEEPARLLRIAGAAPGAWSLVGLRPATGYIGAVAAPVSGVTVQFGWWTAVQPDRNRVSAIPVGEMV